VSGIQGGAVSASKSLYDSTESGLAATNVQDAIDEVAGGVIVSTGQAIINKVISSAIEVPANHVMLHRDPYIATGGSISLGSNAELLIL
jgi:hypothetical protein